jgi:hypothetical protein
MRQSCTNYLLWLLLISFVQAVDPPWLGTPKEAMIILNGVQYAQPTVTYSTRFLLYCPQDMSTSIRELNTFHVMRIIAGHSPTPQKAC